MRQSLCLQISPSRHFAIKNWNFSSDIRDMFDLKKRSLTGIEIRTGSWKLPGGFTDFPNGKYQKLQAQGETSCFPELIKLSY